MSEKNPIIEVFEIIRGRWPSITDDDARAAAAHLTAEEERDTVSALSSFVTARALSGFVSNTRPRDELYDIAAHFLGASEERGRPVTDEVANAALASVTASSAESMGPVLAAIRKRLAV